MDESPATAAGAECFFHKKQQQQQRAISWLLAYGASGYHQRFRSAVGSFPISRSGDEDADGSTAPRPRSQAAWTGKQDRDVPGDSVRIRNSQTEAPASELY